MENPIEEYKSKIDDDKYVCLELAIEAHEHIENNAYGHSDTQPNGIVETAKIFYNYLTNK